MGTGSRLIEDDWGHNVPPDALVYGTDPPEVRDSWLRVADDDEQAGAILLWFKTRYEDPANCTPYNRDEGYVFIYGGPYSPGDTIADRFAGIASEAAMDRAIHDLQMEVGDQWSPIRHHADSEFDYDERYDVPVTSEDAPLERLRERIEAGQAVLSLQGDASVKAFATMLVFSSFISAFEAFLWETVEFWLERDPVVLRNIVANTSLMGDEKILLREIFSRHDRLKEQVKGQLQTFIWHRWDKVERLLIDGLQLPSLSLARLQPATLKRHDIVHRSGHNVAGTPVSIAPDEINSLRAQIESFAVDIFNQLKRRNGLFGSDAADF